MLIKTAMWYHFEPTRQATIKTEQNQLLANRSELELSYIANGGIKWYKLSGNHFGSFLKN